jgi:hypothetical protein
MGALLIGPLVVVIGSNNCRGEAGCQSESLRAGLFVVDYRPFKRFYLVIKRYVVCWSIIQGWQ